MLGVIFMLPSFINTRLPVKAEVLWGKTGILLKPLLHSRNRASLLTDYRGFSDDCVLLCSYLETISN